MSPYSIFPFLSGLIQGILRFIIFICRQEKLPFLYGFCLQFCLHFCSLTLCEKCHYSELPGQYFLALGLNTERYGISLSIHTKCGEMRFRKTQYSYISLCFQDKDPRYSRNLIDKITSRISCKKLSYICAIIKNLEALIR